jgi:ectoine hydroxylase-related dioxygenase (phytanoyl-CoA dioxygenase family)
MRAEGDPRTQRTYWIDGNRYVDAARTTFQFEHRSGSETLRVVEPFHHLDPRLDALVDDPRLVHPMRGVIGTDGVSLWTEKINLKRPHEGSGFRWHQDSPYWVHACDHVDLLPNALVALDDADLSNGCFRVVRGSHRRGTLPGIQDETTLGPLFTDPDHFDESQQGPAEVPAGSIVFFSPHTVHGSQPNLSSSPRRAMVLTYQPADQPMFKLDGVRNAGGVRADAA